MIRTKSLLTHTMNFFWWLSVPLFWWMRVRVISGGNGGHFEFASDKPVIYVLPYQSLSDLLVLDHYCKTLKLPRPRFGINQISTGGQAAFLCLSKLGIFQPWRDSNTHLLQSICSRVAAQKKLDIQLVPVSIIWGRNPGSEDPSLFKLLFPDEEHAGLLQKFFIILAQGRNTVVHFGQPISLRAQVDLGPNPEQVSRKLRRVMRVHFRTQRNITLGPKKYDRARVLRYIFDAPRVQTAIAAEAKKTAAPLRRVQEKVRHYLSEIAAAQSPSVLRFFDVILKFVWNRIYDGILVRNAEIIRDVAKENELVYVVSHRSHLDYLILPYELYQRGLATPHTAAGINLAFWPAGPIIRRGGGFFIRRSFRGNRLYTAVFGEYLNYLIVKGHPVMFFPEGGRSRTGRLLPPKTGMMAMIVQSYIRNPEKPVALMPVYVGYDKVAEVRAYLNELRGAAKKKENFFDTLKAWRLLRVNHGKAYLSFGKPIYLNTILDQAYPSWRDISVADLEAKPAWFAGMIQELTEKCMNGINSAAVASPVGIVGLALLATPQRALVLDELTAIIEALCAVMRQSTLAEQSYVPELTPLQMIEASERVAPINRYAQPGELDVIFLNEIDASLLVYYRNNMIHLIAIASFVCLYVIPTPSVSRAALENALHRFYRFLSSGFTIPVDPKDLSEELRKLLTTLESLKLVRMTSPDEVSRPELASMQFNTLRLFARMLGFAVERYCIAISVLAQASMREEKIPLERFERYCEILARNLAVLKGVADPETSERANFKPVIKILTELGIAQNEAQTIRAHTEVLAEYSTIAEHLMGSQIWKSVRNQIADLEKNHKS